MTIKRTLSLQIKNSQVAHWPQRKSRHCNIFGNTINQELYKARDLPKWNLWQTNPQPHKKHLSVSHPQLLLLWRQLHMSHQGRRRNYTQCPIADVTIDHEAHLEIYGLSLSIREAGQRSTYQLLITPPPMPASPRSSHLPPNKPPKT